MSITGWAFRNRAVVYLAAAMVTVAGLYAMLTLPAGIYPEATFPRIAVLASGGTFEPPEMIVAVTRPLEEAISGVIDLRRIRSRTVRGGTELSLEFRPGADMQFALQQVQGRLAALQPSLPDGVSVFAERLTPSVFPMMQFELTGADPVLLRDVAQYIIKPRLARLPDVGDVSVLGGLVREVSVELDPERLATRRVSVTEVADRIRTSNVATAAGLLDREYRQFSVIVSGLVATPDAVGNLVVRTEGGYPTRVRDLGTVRYGTEDRFVLATGNGTPAALISVARQPQGNTLLVEQSVQAAVDSIRPSLPAGMKLESVYNQGHLVREAVASVRDAMLIGGALAVLVLLVFLGRPRITAVAAATLPLTIAGTFGGLALLGDSLNLMSLGGLAVAIGLIIDDAVVVIENIERRLGLAQGAPIREVIRQATDEVLAPVAGSTLTTVVVFLPLGLLEGVVGQFFRSFSLALTIAVLLSLVYAVLLIPLLAAAAHKAVDAEPRRLSTLPFERLSTWYGARLSRLMRAPRRALVVVGILLAATFGLSKVVETGFMPDLDEGGFILDYFTPVGTSLAETDRQLHLIEEILRADPAVEGFSRRTGAELGFFATAPNQGDMTVLLKPRSQRASVYDVMARLRTRIEGEVPAVRVEFVQILQDLIGDLAGAPNPIEIKLFHPDMAVAERAAASVAESIADVPGLVDLFDGVFGPVPEIHVALDPVRVSRLGLTEQAVTEQARGALFGMGAGEVREPDRLVPIRVRIPDSARFNPDIAASLPIVGPAGWATLGALGGVTDTAVPSELQRENLRPLAKVTGAVDVSSSDLGSVMGAIRARVAKVPLPAGVRLEYGGQYAGQRDSFRQLLLVLALAAGTVLLVMVAQFGGFRGPAVILLAVPLGLTGALGALALASVPFNVSSFMGLVLLVGLIVKNGIILFDAARTLHHAGQPAMDALLSAGQLRLRPILMTTLCTLAGLAPLAFGFGAGAELQRPLAIAVIGGLAISTAVTLLLLPVGLLSARALRDR